MADVTEMQENEANEVDPKAAKKAAKEAKKAAKKAKKEAKKNGEEYEDDDESLGIGGRLIMGVVVLLIILIWLVSKDGRGRIWFNRLISCAQRCALC